MSGGASGQGSPVARGTRFNDRYEVLEEIGRGGMGIVYRGRDTRLGREVAIKVLPEAFSTDDEIIARFGREARAMAALDHPNVVPVYDTGRQGNFNYFVMKFLDGRTVADRLDDIRDGAAQPYGAEEVRQVVMQACRGLGHAHRRGMVHRDVKPGNIMVSPEGHVTIMDFGIVKAPTGGEALTRTGIVFGTPEYMAPEQAQGEGTPQPPADLYSLGVVAYEMLTGDPPFTGSTPFSLVIKHIKEPPPPLIERRPDLDQAFQDVIFKALAKDPAERYADAEAMWTAFDELGRPARGSLPPSLITGEMLRQSSGVEIPGRGTGGHRDERETPPPSPPVVPRPARAASRGQRRASPAVAAQSPGPAPEPSPSPARPAPRPPVRRPPAPAAVVHPRPAPPDDAGPAVLEDRAGYYTSLVTRDPSVETVDARRSRWLVLVVGIAVVLALLAAGIALFSTPATPMQPAEGPEPAPPTGG